MKAMTQVLHYFLVYFFPLYKSVSVYKRPSFEGQSERRWKVLRAASLEVLVMACKRLLVTFLLRIKQIER